MPYNKEDITRYLEDEMNPEEKEQFEAAMKADPSLEEEVFLYKEVSDVLKKRLPEDRGVNELRSGLKQLNATHFRAQKAKLFSLRRYKTAIAVAAAAILLVVTLWPRGSYTDRYGGIEMITSTERGDNSDSLLQQASVHFNKGEFKEALPLLEAAVKADSISQMALFYQGVAKQRTGDYVAGRKDLEKVYFGESVFQYEAAFNIALGFAEQKSREKAIEWLKKIPEGTDASEKAGKLLKKLQ